MVLNCSFCTCTNTAKIPFLKLQKAKLYSINWEYGTTASDYLENSYFISKHFKLLKQQNNIRRCNKMLQLP